MAAPAVGQEEAAALREQVQQLQAALEASESARLAAEERAGALAAGQQTAASRELLSLQSLFKHAVEENRGLATKLQAAQARIAQLEAAAAAQQEQSAWQEGTSGQPPQPIAAQRGPQPAEHGTGQTACQPTEQCAALQRQKVQRALQCQALLQDGAGLPAAALPQGASWEALAAVSVPPQSLHSHYTVTALPGSMPGSVATRRYPPIYAAVPEPAAQAEPEAEASAPPAAQPQHTAPPPGSTPSAGLQQVHLELRALQQRVQAAEQLLQRQAAATQAPAPVPAVPAALRITQRWAAGGDAQQGVDSRGAAFCSSPVASRPGSPGACLPSRPGSAAARQREHRENWQLIRSLKQRRTKLEAERLAALSATLAANALQQAAAQPAPPALRAAATPRAHASDWQFDTQDPPAAAALLQQPLPRQAALRRPASATSTWGRLQHAGHSAVKAPAPVPARGRSREASPMSWHAAGQELPAASRSVPGSRGRRASLAADPQSTSRSRHARSRSRSEQEEVDRLLMSGRPTTLLGGGGLSSGSGGGSAQKRQGRRAGWVPPVVVA